MPPDLRSDASEADRGFFLTDWGIDVWSDPTLAEVLAARAASLAVVRDLLDDLTPASFDEPVLHNPPWIPSTSPIPMAMGLDLVVREERAHHGFAVRDLATLGHRV